MSTGNDKSSSRSSADGQIGVAVTQQGTEVPLRRSALRVCPCGDPWGTLLQLEIIHSWAPIKPPRGQTLRSPRPRVASVITRLLQSSCLCFCCRFECRRCFFGWDLCLLQFYLCLLQVLYCYGLKLIVFVGATQYHIICVYPIDLVHGADEAHADGLEEREAGEDDQVRGVLPAPPDREDVNLVLFWRTRKEASPTSEGPLLKRGENYSSFDQECSKCRLSANKTLQCASARRGSHRLSITASRSI